MNTYDATIDGADATVTHRNAPAQSSLIELTADDLCSLLAAKSHELGKQTEVADREKKRQKVLETQYSEIVLELRKRGEERSSGQTRLFQPAPPATPRETLVDGPIVQSGTSRVALTGSTPSEVLAETESVPHGIYPLVPQEASPEFCVCGSLMTLAIEEHDAAHAEYLEASAQADVTDAAAAATPAPADPLAEYEHTRCSSCKAEMVFGLSPNLKTLPIDATPVADGLYVVGDRVQSVNGTFMPALRKVTKDDDGTVLRYQSHYKSCNDPAKFSRRRGARA